MSVRGPPYLCSDCKIEYSVYSSFRSHVLMKHTTPNKKCSYCDTKFHTNATLNAHMYKCMHTTTHNTQNETVKTKQHQTSYNEDFKTTKRCNPLRLSMFSDDNTDSKSSLHTDHNLSI